MKKFKYSCVWWIPTAIIMALMLDVLYEERQALLHFFYTGSGSRMTGYLALSFVITSVGILFYYPYVLIKALMTRYYVDDHFFYIRTLGKEQKMPLNELRYVLRKQDWTFWLGGPFLRFTYEGKRYKLVPGFYLDKVDYCYLKSLIYINEPKTLFSD